MISSNQSKIFFMLIFTVMFGNLQVYLEYKEYFEKNKYMFFVLPLICTLALYYIYDNICKKSIDNFTFEVTPAKRCEGWPYMTQSGPYKEYCDKLMSSEEGRKEFVSMNCCSGMFNGRPKNLK